MSAAPPPPPPPGSIAITGLGLTTSIGLDAVASCASSRAGVTRWTQLDIEEPDMDTLESVPLKGHAVRGLTDGFDGHGRLLRLGDAALASLLDYSGLTAVHVPRTGFHVCLPGDFHATQRLQVELLAESAPDEIAWDELRTHFEEQQQLQEEIRQDMVPRLLSLHGLSISPSACACFFGGPAAFIQAVRQAMHRIGIRELDRCIVGGMDSFVHGAALETAYELGLLRTAERASRFFPGEAGAFVLLERADAARARGARSEGMLGPLATAEETAHRLSGEPPQGMGLSSALEACLPRGRASPNLVIVNLNGDDYRAQDFGHALVRMGSARLPTPLRQWYPANSFGEIGAATGAAAVCLAIRGFVGGYAGSREALILLLGDDPARGAMLVSDIHSQPR